MLELRNMPSYVCLLFLLCLLRCNCGTEAASSAANTIIVPGIRPNDTNGNSVEAHGGGILTEGDVYFWYGTTQKQGVNWLSEGINLYSSRDLKDWTFEGELLNANAITDMPFPPPYRIERPKIVFNDKTKQYVMMWHLDTATFAYPAVGVATAAELKGPWKYERVFKPDGRNSYDMTLYKDADGTAYLVRSVENQFLGISKLTEDYLDTTGGICSSAPQSEGPAVFQDGGYYYIFASHLTGWAANPPFLFRSTTLCGGKWDTMPDPAVGKGAETTFNSQSTFVFPFSTATGNVYVLMADRWNFYGPGCVGNASYVWLPLQPTSTNATGPSFFVAYLSSWRLADFAPSVVQAVLTAVRSVTQQGLPAPLNKLYAAKQLTGIPAVLAATTLCVGLFLVITALVGLVNARQRRRQRRGGQAAAQSSQSQSLVEPLVPQAQQELPLEDTA